MLKPFLSLFFFLQMLSVTAQSGYQIDVTIKGFESDQAYLGYYLGAKTYIKDTVSAVNGHFVFSGKEVLDDGIYIIIDPKDYSFFEIVLSDDQHLSLSTVKGQENKMMKVQGSEENELFFGYLHYLEKQYEEMDVLKQDMEGLDPSTESYQRDEQSIALIEEKIKNYRTDFASKTKNSFLGTIIRLTQEMDFPEALTGPDADPIERYNYYMKHYFDDVDFSAAGLKHVPAFYKKIDDYLGRLVVQHVDSLKLAVDRLLNLASVNDEMFQYVTIETINKFAKSKIMGMDGVYAHIVENYYATGRATWADENTLQLMIARAKMIQRILLYRPVETVNGKDENGDAVALHDTKAVLTFVLLFDPSQTEQRQRFEAVKEVLAAHDPADLHLVSIASNGTYEEWKKVLGEWELTNQPKITNIYTETDAFLYSQTNQKKANSPILFLLDDQKYVMAKDLDVKRYAEIIDTFLNGDK